MGAVKVVGIGVGAVFAAMAGLEVLGNSLEAEFQKDAMASSASIDASEPAAIRPDNSNAPEPASLSERHRATLVETDPEMKAASDYVGALINLNGHLCAKVTNVVSAGGSNFEVTCVQYRNGSGRVRYLVNGETNSAVPL